MTLANQPQNDPLEPFDVLRDLAQAQSLTAKAAALQQQINNQYNQPNIMGTSGSGSNLGAWTTTTAGTAWTNVAPAYGTVTTNGYAYSPVEDEPSKETNLGALIAKAGKYFYYLVSPEANTDGDGMWHAKGKRAFGKGTTPEEAVQNLIDQLTTDE